MKKATVEQMKREIREIKSKQGFPQWMIRKDGLFLQNTKTKLVEALNHHHHRITCLIRIQSAWRTYLACCLYKFKKPRKICANDSDFCTMDPLEEIPTGLLICVQYSPHTPFYGFNIISLLNYFHKSRANVVTNPYNRDPISFDKIQQWIHLTGIFSPTIYNQLISESYYKYFLFKKKSVLQSPVRELTANNTANNTAIQYNNVIIFEEEQLTLQHHLTQIQYFDINTRIHELFIDFDLCGNYTNANWFLQLNLRFLKMFYTKLKECWRNLPSPIQQSICTLGDPFYLVQIQHLNLPFQEMKLAAVRIMEYITYGTHNREDQKLGVFQILIALASVSYPAHNSLTHLIGET